VRLRWLLLAGLVLRLPRLPVALEYDEQFSWILTQLPLDRLLAATAADVHPPLYYLILRGWGELFGFGEIALRLPSVLAGVAVIALTHRLGRQLKLTPSVTWIATLIATVAPFQIFFSQRARVYEIETLMFLLAAIGIVERRRWLTVVAACSTLYLHNTAMVSIAVLFVAGWIWRSDKKSHLLEFAVVFIGFVPGMPLLMSQARGVGAGYWIGQDAWFGLVDAIDGFTSLIFYWLEMRLDLVLLPLMAIALLATIDALLSRPPLSARVLALLALGPTLLLALISALWKPVLLPRIVAPSAPFFYLLMSWTLLRAGWRKGLLYGLIFLALAGSALDAWQHRPLPPQGLGWPEPTSGSGLYHLTPGSYVSYRYAGRSHEVKHVVAPMGLGLEGGGASAATAEALGLEIGELGSVLCEVPEWTILWIDGAPIPRSVRDHMNQLLALYEPELLQIETITRPALTTLAVYRFETPPFCSSD